MNTGRRVARAWLVTAMGAALQMGSAATPEIRPFAEVVRGYVGMAMESNLGLRGQELEVERSAAALDAAKARFFPELSLDARYTRADGGRTIDFPVGQMLNPAYQTLNQLLIAQGQQPRFASLQDQSFAFQRPHEQDTRVTLRQPLYQPGIPAAVTAQREQLSSQQYARVAFAQQLRVDVIVGYATYLRALRSSEILRSASTLLGENVRVTDSLFRNGRITQDQVLRARAELLASTQQQREAQGGITQARSYVNFLMNRPLDLPLEDATPTAEEAPSPANLESLRGEAPQRRMEIAQLDALSRAADAQVRAARAALKPQLGLGVDAGTQGEQYRTGAGYNFIAASLVMSWKFFDGGANRAAVAEARSAARSAAVKRDDVAQRVQLEVQQAIDRLDTARDSLATASAREEAAVAAFRIASRKRDEGAFSQVEFLDSRNALTTAQLNLNLTRFELIQRSAELEHAAGAGELPTLRPIAQGTSP